MFFFPKGILNVKRFFFDSWIKCRYIIMRVIIAFRMKLSVALCDLPKGKRKEQLSHSSWLSYLSRTLSFAGVRTKEAYYSYSKWRRERRAGGRLSCWRSQHCVCHLWQHILPSFLSTAWVDLSGERAEQPTANCPSSVMPSFLSFFSLLLTGFSALAHSHCVVTSYKCDWPKLTITIDRL